MHLWSFFDPFDPFDMFPLSNLLLPIRDNHNSNRPFTSKVWEIRHCLDSCEFRTNKKSWKLKPDLNAVYSVNEI